MFEDKLLDIKKRYEELNMTLSQPDTINDQENYTKLLKQHAEMTEIAQAIDKYIALNDEIKEYEDLIESGDEELSEIAKDEIVGAKDALG